ncbi:MAG: LCP family protein [Patescibacteria group bacterium]|nr:LCP family protein [Patescibacteria group bacterium]
MDQKPRRTKIPADGLSRPRQDAVTVKEQAGQFPGVGVTLRNYKYDPRDQRKGANARGTVVKQSRFSRFRKTVTLKRTVVLLALLIVIVGGFLGGKFAYNAQKAFGGNILGVLHATKLKGEENGRVNILLAGNSADDIGHNGAQLTDSIMIMSIDTKNNKAFLMSVPRDLYVQVGSDGHEKINQAYVDGESSKFRKSGYPNGGMGQLEEVVEDSFGLKMNYYALVNYNALKQSVDAVGGVDFTVKSKDPRGLYDPNIDYTTNKPLVKLTNGVHHLNGQQALNLSRARGDSYRSYGFPASDFDRTEHQRQLLVALKTKAVTTGVLANPSKLSSLTDVLGKNVKSDMQVSEVRRLYDLVKNINSANIRSLSLNNANGKNLLMSYTAPGGQSALAPAAGLDDFSDIQTFILQQTSSNAVVQEGASVVVLNGTTSTGLASKQKLKLSEKHLSVDGVGDAKADSAVTTIIDVSGGKKPASSLLLKQLYGSQLTTANPYQGIYDTDFIIVVGADQIPKQSTTSTTQP